MEEKGQNYSEPERLTKGNITRNYILITCLRMTGKIPIAQKRGQLNYSLVNRELFPRKQNGYGEGARETDDQLYIEEFIHKEVKVRRKKQLWHGFTTKKRLVVWSRKLGCLKIFKISDKIINFITKAMESWKVEFAAVGKTLADVKIQRGIFLRLKLTLTTTICYRNGATKLCT